MTKLTRDDIVKILDRQKCSEDVMALYHHIIAVEHERDCLALDFEDLRYRAMERGV